MLPKKFRLKINEFYRDSIPAEKLFTQRFVFLSKPSGKSEPRFSVAVKKNLDKRSSNRNKTRRIILEAIKKQLENIKHAKDVLIIARKTLHKTEKTLVENEILTGLKNNNLM